MQRGPLQSVKNFSPRAAKILLKNLLRRVRQEKRAEAGISF
jgi:hypothetical protein